jgi:hypothetical protein
METPLALEPGLFAQLDSPLISTIPDDFGVMARHSQLSSLQGGSHSRHQSVPAFPSPQNSGGQQSRGLAKLTLVERLSKESIPSPTSGDNHSQSPKSTSPSRFDDGSPRPTHSPRRSRMSLTIPPTKTATIPVNTSPVISPLRQAPPLLSSTSKHVPSTSLGEITMSPTHFAHDRAMTSPTVSALDLEEVAALDDANATFLTLIAFQERRVVELREELARAESELDLLKQQWTRQQLKLTRSARQEHVRQNSITKLEQQMLAGSATPRQEDNKSPQLLVAGKRIAEGVRDGFFNIMEDLKTVAANENATLRQRTRSPTRPGSHDKEDVGLGIVAEKVDPPLWYPKGGSPVKRSVRSGSDGSETASTHESSSSNTRYHPNEITNEVPPAHPQ